MRIGIIGAGAMGCLYGGKLSATDNGVYLLDIWQEHVSAINRGGLHMEEEGKTLHYTGLRASTDAEEIGHVDLAIVFVKSIYTEKAVRANKAIFGPETVALTLQNGIGNIEKIGREVGMDRIIAGTTAHGATMLEAGHIRHAGFGNTVIGELDGKVTPRLKKIRNVMNLAGMETEVSENILGVIWDKLLVNVAINALTGITGVNNGKLKEYSSLERIMEVAIEEGEAVAQGKGIRIGTTHQGISAFEHAKMVARATADNRSSMLQDLLKGKKTEIDTINGAVVKEGQRLGIPTPVNQTLVDLIHFYEEYRRQERKGDERQKERK